MQACRKDTVAQDYVCYNSPLMKFEIFQMPTQARASRRNKLRRVNAWLSRAVLASCMWVAALPVQAQAPDLRQLELSYLRSAVAANLLDYAGIEVPAIENIRQDRDETGPFLALRTYYRQPLKNGGVRAEISVDYPFRDGDRVRYAWRMKLPADFTADTGGNRWWIVGQWHDQPNRNRGETWAGYPGHSPAVGLGYGRTADGQDMLSLLYGAPDPKPAGLFPIPRGIWIRLAVEIEWSTGSNGRVQVFVNDAAVPVREARGRNMYNDFQHYMKVVGYRHPDIRGDAWIQIADIEARTLAPR